jgi:hypothetical protein
MKMRMPVDDHPEAYEHGSAWLLGQCLVERSRAEREHGSRKVEPV